MRSPLRLSMRRDAGHAPVFDDEIERGDVFHDLDGGMIAYCLDERFENLVSGRIAARFDDAAALMRGLAAQRKVAAPPCDRTPRRVPAALRPAPAHRW